MTYPQRPILRDDPARYDIRRQDAGLINNVARDQHNSYVAHVQQRDSFLREVASTRTKARWLVWLGVLTFLAGFGVFAAGALRFIAQVSNGLGSDETPQITSPLGPKVWGVPSGLLGWAVAAVGGVLILLGIILHVTATSRRRRIERDFVVPYQPWQ